MNGLTREQAWRAALKVPINEVVASNRDYMDLLVERAISFADLEQQQLRKQIEALQHRLDNP